MSVAVRPDFAGSLSRGETIIDVVNCIVDSLVTLERVMNDIVATSETTDEHEQLCAIGDIAMIREASTRAIKDAKYIVDTAELRLLQLMGDCTSYGLPNGATVETFVDTKEVYDDDAVTLAIANILKQHAYDVESGQMILEPEKAPAIVELVRALLGKSKPRKQALKAHKVDINTLMTVEYGDRKVRVVAPEPEVSQPAVTMVTGGGEQ